MQISWKVNNLKGSCKLNHGANHIIVPMPEGTTLKEVSAKLPFAKSSKMFFNGFQTWTNCPEYTPYSKIRGLHGLPRIMIDKFALDRYGDYHFVDYPNKKGVLHGISYCYFRDKQFFRLLASLDETPGYTCFSYSCNEKTMTITRDCKGVSSPAEFHAFDLFYAEGTEEEVFDAWFKALDIKNIQPRIKGYSSWYNHYQDINEQGIRDDLKGAAKVFEPGDLFQIDDGWEPFVGDWETTDKIKFPNGLKPVADDIHAQGYQAGLWLAPFVCEEKSDIFKNHKDWLLSYNGEPWKDGCNWSGFYSLDIDNPEVVEYLTRVFKRVFEEWNFDLVKLDFLYAAAPFATGDHGPASAQKGFAESRAARMQRALRLLRKLCEGKLILGCGVPVMPSFGLVDYCRVGCDVGLDWNDKPYMRIIHRERVSTKQSLENTIFRSALNGRAHGNDPDVFFLRDNNLKLTEEEKEYLASVNMLLGSVWLTSDNLNAYTPEKIKRYKRLQELANATEVSVDYNTLSVSYKLNGKAFTLKHPHAKS